MEKETISDIQGICLIILFISGETLAMQTATRAGSDLWLAIIAAMAIAIPIVFMYARLLTLFPNKDLFDIIELLFGKYFGKILSLLFIIYIFQAGALVLRDISESTVTTTLPETPKTVFMIFYIVLGIWIVKAGIEVMGRWANLFVILNGPLPTIAILLLIPEMDFNNIRPVLFNGINPLMEGTFQALTFPFAETVVFTMVLYSLKTKKSPYNIYLKGLLIGGILIAGVSLAEILVLGSDIYSATYFPNQNVATKVNIGEFIQRIEIIAMIAIVTSSFLKLSVYLLAVTRGISKLFGFKDYRFIVTPVAALLMNFSNFNLGQDNIMELFKFIDDIWPYFALPFQILLPLIIFIFAEIKGNRLKAQI